MEIETFKATHPFFSRKDLADRVLQRFHDRVPVYLGRHPTCTIELENYKYLAPIELTLNQMRLKIKYKKDLAPDRTLFFYSKERLMPIELSVGNIYDRYKDDDGFLYLIYCDESVME